MLLQVIEDYTESMNDIIKMYNPDTGIDKTLYQMLKIVYDYRYAITEENVSNARQYQEQLFISDEGKWLHPLKGVKLLKQLPFFNRLSEKLIMDNLSKLKVYEKKQHDLIFPETSVIIILNGRVVLRRHEKNPLDHRTLASYTAGSILGFEQGDDGLCKDCDIWMSVVSRFV